MIYTLSLPVRRLIALFLLLLVIAALELAIVEPIATYVADLQDRIDQERQVLARLQAAVADKTGTAGIVKAAPDLNGVVLDGESDQVKLATLQSRLAELAAARGLKLRSARNLPKRDRNGFKLIGLQLQIAGPLEALQQALLTIEDQQPLLIIDALQVTPLPTGNEEEKGFLDARLDIYGVSSLRKGS